MNPINDLQAAASDKRGLDRPFTLISYAQSLDGSLAPKDGKRYRFSCQKSLALTHEIRARADALLVGIGTVLNDDPLLTVRLADGNHPLPVIIDPKLRTPLTANLFKHPLRPWIFAQSNCPADKKAELEAHGASVFSVSSNKDSQLDLSEVLQILLAKGIRFLMVEGGIKIISSFIREKLADWMLVTVSPILMDGNRTFHTAQSSPASSPLDSTGFPEITPMKSGIFDKDTVIWGPLNYRDK